MNVCSWSVIACSGVCGVWLSMLVGVASVYNTLHCICVCLKDGFCHASDAVCGVTLTDYRVLPTGNVSALVVAIYEQGPISIAIDASLKTFSFYSDGVYYDSKCGKNQWKRIGEIVLAASYTHPTMWKKTWVWHVVLLL